MHTIKKSCTALKKKKSSKHYNTPFSFDSSRSKCAPKLPALPGRRCRAQQHPAQACAGSSPVAASFAGELGGLLPGLGRTSAVPCSRCPAALGAFQPPRVHKALGSPNAVPEQNAAHRGCKQKQQTLSKITRKEATDTHKGKRETDFKNKATKSVLPCMLFDVDYCYRNERNFGFMSLKRKDEKPPRCQ